MSIRALFSAILMLVCGVGIACADPVLFYTDLISGPKADVGEGKDDNGCWVTIYGKGFGSTRGTSTVTIGGGEVGDYTYWSDEKIIVQLGSNVATGSIVVTVGGVASNPLNFVVRSGRVFFVSNAAASAGSGTYASPWKSPASFISQMRAGDVCYIRQGNGAYTGKYGRTDGDTQFLFSWMHPDGAANNEIAIVGYPGERPVFDALTTSFHGSGYAIDYCRSYYVLANMHFKAYYGNNNTGKYNRIIDCKHEGGIPVYFFAQLGTGMHNNPDNFQALKVYGCEFFGARSHEKQDHCIYLNYGSDYVDIGWCKFYDNDINEGPIIQMHSDQALAEGWNSIGQKIHDCIFDCRYTYPTTDKNVLRPYLQNCMGPLSTMDFYNNVIIAGDVCDGRNYFMYVRSGSFNYYNNTLFNIGSTPNNSFGWGPILLFEDGYSDSGGTRRYYWPQTVNVKNNIFYNTDTGFTDDGYISIDSGIVGVSTITITNNLYYGTAMPVPVYDQNPINADPLFVSTNPASFDFRVKSGSPCIGAGVNTTAVAPRDRDGVSRLTSGSTIGAYEYTGGDAPAYYTVSGNVRDGSGVGIANVTVTLSGAASRTYTTSTDGYYEFTNLLTGNYIVTPSRTGYSFVPTSTNISSLSSDTVVNFTGSAVSYKINGYIKDINQQGVSGVTVALTGTVSTTVSTGLDGFYEFTGLPQGANCTITPYKTEWTFTPTNRNMASLINDWTNQNFEGTHDDTPPSDILNPGQFRVKVSGVVVNNIYLGNTAEVEFVGYSTGTYHFQVFGPDGYINYDATLYDVDRGTFTWVPAVPTGRQLPVIKGPDMWEYKPIQVFQ